MLSYLSTITVKCISTQCRIGAGDVIDVDASPNKNLWAKFG